MNEKSVQDMMDDIANNYPVFRVGVMRTDYDHAYTAYCEIRGKSVECSARGNTPEDALRTLGEAVRSMFCQKCGRLL